VITLAGGTLPVAAAEPPEPGVTPRSTEDPGTGFGGGVDPEPRACDPEPCPETATTSGGTGGFIAVAAENVLDTRDDGDPLGRDETRSFAVGGVGSVPLDGVQAVLLGMTAGDATGWSSLTVWPAGSGRPAITSLDVQPGRDQRTAVVVPLGEGGRISAWNDRGDVNVVVDVLGWFAWATEYHAIAPQRILDTSPGGRAKPAPLGPGATVSIPVAGGAGIPSDARAVVLDVASRTATAVSSVAVWPAGDDRPAQGSLVAHPVDRRGNLVVVQPGIDGAVSIHNAAGWTHLTVDVVGWLPASSSYRPVTPTTLAPATALAPGASMDLAVTGVAGIPAAGDETATESAYAVALNITATPAADAATGVVAWPTGDTRPATMSVATTATTAPTTSLSIVRVGNDGRVSLANGVAAADVRVEVVGWFASPIVAAQLEVPETTIAPDPADVTPLEVVTGPGPTPEDPPQIAQATVELAPEAAPAEVGGHLVLAPGGTIGTAGIGARLALDEPVEEAFPEGFLGEIVTVETMPDGTQVVTAVPAMLEDVFPEGDIAVDLNTDTKYEGELLWGPAGDPPSVVLAAVAPPTKGVQVDFEYIGDGKTGKKPGTDVDCSMDGIAAEFGPLIDMQFSVRWRWMRAPVVTALATLGAEARLALADVSVNCGVDIRLWKATVTFMAGTVPVVVVFEVGAALDIAAGLDGLNLSAEAAAYVTIGVKDNRGYADAGYDFDLTSFDDLAAQVSNLALYGQADVWLHFTVKLYSVIGPRISVGPFIEAAVTSAATQPWWRIDFGLAGKIALRLDLWFHEWNWNLYESEIPLADILVAAGALEDCPAMPYAVSRGPCRSERPIARASGPAGSRVLFSRIRLASAGEPMRFLTIDPPAVVSPASVGTPYALALTASGVFDDAGKVTWSTPAAGLGVPGLALRQEGAGAVIEGTPTTAGSQTATVEIRQAWDDPGGPPRSVRSIPITVQSVGAPVCIGYPVDVPQGTGFATVPDCTDPDGDQLSYWIGTPPAHGTATMSEDTFEYTAPTDHLGPDPFTIVASDGTLTSEPATILVTVTEAVIFNGDFEAGDLAGWVVENQGGRAETSAWFVWSETGVGPHEGATFGLIGSTGLPVSIRQTVVVHPGEVLGGAAWVLARPGTGEVRILDGEGTVVATPVSGATWPAWTSWSYAVTEPGFYTVVAEVAGGAYLGLDAVTITR
jgi:hypothetical protein